MSRFEDLDCIFQLLVYTMAWVKESQEEIILICNLIGRTRFTWWLKLCIGCD